MIYIYVNKYFLAHYKTMESVIQYVSRQNARHIDEVATLKIGLRGDPINISWPLLILICRDLVVGKPISVSALGESYPLSDDVDLYSLLTKYKTERLFYRGGSVCSSGSAIETVFR